MSTHPDLTSLQLAAARLFFELPESKGFVLAGGAALIASGLITRATNDIDLFAVHRRTSSIPDAATSFETAAHTRGWTTRRIVDQREFVRLLITNGDESLVIDLGRDSPPDQPTHHTILGPTLAERDLAAPKTLALYGRAEGRDFADIYHLAHRFGRDNLIILGTRTRPRIRHQHIRHHAQQPQPPQPPQRPRHPNPGRRHRGAENLLRRMAGHTYSSLGSPRPDGRVGPGRSDPHDGMTGEAPRGRLRGAPAVATARSRCRAGTCRATPRSPCRPCGSRSRSGSPPTHLPSPSARTRAASTRPPTC